MGSEIHGFTTLNRKGLFACFIGCMSLIRLYYTKYPYIQHHHNNISSTRRKNNYFVSNLSTSFLTVQHMSIRFIGDSLYSSF